MKPIMNLKHKFYKNMELINFFKAVDYQINNKKLYLIESIMKYFMGLYNIIFFC